MSFIGKLENVLHYKDVKYQCIEEKYVNCKIHAFLLKHAGSAHLLHIASPFKTLAKSLTEIISKYRNPEKYEALK